MTDDRRENPVVLVVDDNLDMRDVMADYFTREGYEVKSAGTPEEAIDIIHETKELMVAFIDIHLPTPYVPHDALKEGKGRVAYALFNYIRRIAKHRVIAYAWTADYTPETEEKAIEAGAFRVFHKGRLSMSRVLRYVTEDTELFRGYSEDDMTGLYNIRGFRRPVLAQLREMREHKVPSVASLVFIDVDKFKFINDTYGDLVGDQAIKYVARVLERSIRPGDRLCRKGGDEFLIWFAGADEKKALTRIRRIKKRLQDLPLKTGQGLVQISVSAGVSSITPEGILADEMETFLFMIDQANTAERREKPPTAVAHS